MLSRLTSFARVIVFDKRGQGLSDRVAGTQTLEERIDDVRAVLDAAGSEQATVFGWSEGGPMSLLFGATHPQRISSLVLLGTFASLENLADDAFEQFMRFTEATWGEGWGGYSFAPSRARDEAFVKWFARIERNTATPGAIVAIMRQSRQIDVRNLLPSARVPSLILHRKGDTNVRVENGRYLAQHVPGAKYVELPDVDHLLQASEQNVMDTMLDEVEEFIAGTHQRPESDRVLATVIFTDIVESTARAAALGDQRWRELLARYYDLVRKELVAFRGREVKTVGDGLLATFDGPARAIRCACGLRDKVREVGLEVRTGLHTGECDLIGNDVGGLAVHIGARVANEANAAEVLVSSTVKDLVVGSGIKFVDRGTHTLKGVPGEWHLFLAR
jgi:class 3 adenylate cyclase